MRHDTTHALPDPWSVPFVSIERAGQCLGLSRRSAYRAAAAGDIPTVRIAGVRRVATADLYRVRRLPVPAPQQRPVIYGSR